MKHRVLIKLAKVALVMAAMYVTILLGFGIGITIRLGYIPVGLLQVSLYAGIVVCIYMLTRKALWAKH